MGILIKLGSALQKELREEEDATKIHPYILGTEETLKEVFGDKETVCLEGITFKLVSCCYHKTNELWIDSEPKMTSLYQKVKTQCQPVVYNMNYLDILKYSNLRDSIDAIYSKIVTAWDFAEEE